jgi:NAD(P)-dependent dehydrogenase (short-subunit alcohol dehydrogenase family)
MLRRERDCGHGRRSRVDRAGAVSQTAVVVGGAGSIGRSLSASLAGRGYQVVVLDAAGHAGQVAHEAGAVARQCDVTDHAAILGAVEDLGSIDVLVNSVGSWPRGAVSDFDPAEWDRVITLNLSAPMYAVAAMLPQLRAARGSVVNLSSTTALRGAPTMIAYSAAKAGLLGLTRSLAAALGPDGVRVNCVLPGVLMTESNASLPPAPFERARSERALGRDGYPGDLVGAVLFFATQASEFVTGQSLIVDGGQLFG